MARVSNEESTALGQETEMKDNWFRSSHSALFSICVSSISCLRSSFTKAETPPALLSTQPPEPLISASPATIFSPNSFTSLYPHLEPIPSPTASYHPSMQTETPNPTVFEPKEHAIDMPGTDSPMDVPREASTARMRSSGLARNLRPAGQSSRTTQSESLPVYRLGNTNTQTPQPTPSQPEMLNPIVRLLRDHELGKTVLTLVIPLMTGVMSVYSKDSSSSAPALILAIALLSLSLGLTALWNGILIRDTFPDAANAVEQFGVVSMFFSFFSVVSSLVPKILIWVPWACFVAILLPSAVNFVSYWRQRRDRPV